MTLIKKENMHAVMDVAVTHERLQNREQASKARELSQEKEIEEICQQMQLQQQQLAKVMESVHKLQEANALQQQQLIEKKIVQDQQQEQLLQAAKTNEQLLLRLERQQVQHKHR